MGLARLAACSALLAGSSLFIGAAPPAPVEAADTGRCEAMARQAFGADVAVTSAAHVDASQADPLGNAIGWAMTSAIPSHCLIEGVIGERVGAGGVTYGIKFAVALPDAWNGRFLLQGGGGLNGTVHPPLGVVATDGRPALTRGFAVVSHDSGHSGAVFDSSFMADQRAALDFAEASVRTVTLLGKAITQTYYGKDIDHSYMTGCSTGGREGMLASQRYPELFDGILVGAPAMRAGDSNLGIKYTQVLLNRISPKAADGTPDVSQLLTPAVRSTLLNGLLAQCDALDGLEDGMIENVGQCRFRPEKLVCTGGNTQECIGADLADALERSFTGPRDMAGYPLYTPVPFDTGMVDLRGGYLPTGAPGPLGPANSGTTIDLDAEIHAIRNNAAGRLTDTNYWTNLNTFLDRDGKLIFFHGVSDFWFSPWATWDYYQRAAETNGAAFTESSRFYMVPGMMHCQGGNAFDQFDMLSKLVDWVEQGEAPEAIMAHRREPADETRPLCPYPSYAAYVGGDESKASSFACKLPS